MEGTVKKSYQYIAMIVLDPKPGSKTLRWSVINKKYKHPLGVVEYHNSWRQYILYPSTDVILSSGCLRDIAEFLDWAKPLRAGKL